MQAKIGSVMFLFSPLLIKYHWNFQDKWRNMNLRKGKGRNSYKPVQENFKKTSRHHNKSAALTTAQTEAPTKSLEDGVSDKPTVMHQQSPQTPNVYTRRHKMHQQSPQTIKVYTRRYKRGNTAIAK